MKHFLLLFLLIPLFFFCQQDSLKITIRAKATIRDIPSYGGNTLDVLTENKVFSILGYENEYLKIAYNNKIGFVNTVWAENNDAISKYIKLKKIEDNHKIFQESLKREQEEKILQQQQEKKILKKYGQKILDRIKGGKIWIGMTSEMARMSIGNPIKINQSVGKWGTHQQWVYDSTYLYFENGILTSYQN